MFFSNCWITRRGFGSFGSESAVSKCNLSLPVMPQLRASYAQPEIFRVGPYVDGSVLARVLFVILAGRCSHMFGLLMRHITRPLAIMLSAKSGPGQQHAFKDAMAQVGCPDCRGDRLSHYMQLPFPNLLAPIKPARIQLSRKRNWFAIVFAAHHHCPDHSYNLIGQCNGRNFDRSPCHKLCQPWSTGVS